MNCILIHLASVLVLNRANGAYLAQLGVETPNESSRYSDVRGI